MVDWDGSARIQLTHTEDSSESKPRFSPDGKYLCPAWPVFVYSPEDSPNFLVEAINPSPPGKFARHGRFVFLIEKVTSPDFYELIPACLPKFPGPKISHPT